MKRVLTSGLVAVVLALAAACGGGDSGDAGPTSPRPTGKQANDSELVQGRQVFVTNCARCHGVKGEGGIGVQLAGRVAQRYPNIDDQIAVIADGKNLMPSFDGDLTPAQMRAVARYEREVL